MSEQSRIPLKRRLIIGFSIPISMLIVSLISNNVFMSNMSGEMADHIANEIPETQALNRLAAASYAMRMDVLVIARTPEPEVCKILEEYITPEIRVPFVQVKWIRRVPVSIIPFIPQKVKFITIYMYPIVFVPAGCVLKVDLWGTFADPQVGGEILSG